MNRFILIILILFVSGVFIRGISGNDKSNTEYTSEAGNFFSEWKEELIDSYDIPPAALNIALNGYYELKRKNLIQVDSLLTIIDFSRSSNDKRLFILDLKNKEIVKNTLVAHGMNSGVIEATYFSNKRNSNKSSLGLYLTNKTYFGKHGYSLRIKGMNEGLNDNAFKRAIVVHGADYVSNNYIEKYGRIGRSFGCPALPFEETEKIIDLIKDGSCLFIYHPSLIPISQTALETLP